jgi:hypothetical protein
VSAVEADKAMFAKALKALGPYLGDLVVVGGWLIGCLDCTPWHALPASSPS